MDFAASRRSHEVPLGRAFDTLKAGLAAASHGHLKLAYSTPDLAVKHNSRTGGTFLMNLLAEMMTDGSEPIYFQERPQPSEHLKDDKQDLFLIAGVRNPCDWYVSQWAFAAQYDKETLKQKYGVDFFGDLHNKTHFGNWMEWAMDLGGKESADRWTRILPEPHYGAMSLRFWESFMNYNSKFPLTIEGYDGYDTTLLRNFTESYAGQLQVESELSAFNPVGAADCWVRVETYMSDLRHCLHEYELRSGKSLFWDPFEREVNEEQRMLFRDKSDHKECGFYYTPELSASVRALDRHIFDAFGYNKCCDAPTARKPPMSAVPLKVAR